MLISPMLQKQATLRVEFTSVRKRTFHAVF